MLLLRSFQLLSSFCDASVEDLANVDEIGQIIAESVHQFLHSEYGQLTIDDLRSVGVKLTEDVQQVAAMQLRVFSPERHLWLPYIGEIQTR